MIYATKDGIRILAQPKQRAECPNCNQIVIAKCGEIKTWHWAHATNDCDTWSEGLTKWHLDWQSCFPVEWQEVNIIRDDEYHRADICTPSGIVVEFQHSSISPDNILLREKFYGPLMRWVFDVREAFESERLSYTFRWTDDHKLYLALNWKHARISIGYARRSIYLDIGKGLLVKVNKLSLTPPYRGWGLLTNRKDFTAGIYAGAGIDAC